MKQIKFLFSLKKNFYRLSFSLILIAVFFSCQDDEPLEIGRNILPDSELLEAFYDTLAVQIYTVEMEPVYAYSIGSSLLGGVIDPVFGRLSADFITDFTFADTGYFNAGVPRDNFRLDTLELVIKLGSSYGYDSIIDFTVYELLSDFPDYQFSDFELTDDMWDQNMLSDGSPYFVVDKTDSSNWQVYIHQKLNDDFMNRLVDTNLVENENIYTNDSIFRSYFKGLYVKNGFVTNNQGGIIRVDYNTAKLVLSATETDSDQIEHDVSFTYVLGYPDEPVGGHSLNMYSYTPENDVSRVLNDSINPQELAYIQSMAGPKIRVQIPELSQLRRELAYGAAVNSAELVITIDPENTDYEIFPPPNVLGVRDFLKDTNIIDDMLVTGYFGAVLDTSRMEYRFNVGSYIHSYLRDSMNFSDETLYLFGGQFVTVPASIANPSEHNITYYNLSTFGRVVLNGGNSSNPPFLRIIYSSLPE